MNKKHTDLFNRYVAKTSNIYVSLEIDSAKGMYVYDTNKNSYLDIISGISVNQLGHRHNAVVKAIRSQLDKHLHIMVYGETVQPMQAEYASSIICQLPDSLQKIYFVNSGTEAIEGALKLAKRYTGRPHIISFFNAYHGSTHGSLSVMGNESFKRAYRPLMPGITLIPFNNPDYLNRITKETACVIVEPIQGEGGVILPDEDFLQELQIRCKETGSLLIFDENQTGFGRTGQLFAFQKYNVVPDILVLGKAIGGGMPLGGFIASEEIMDSITTNPMLGHFTTFGGHPVSCAAGLATLNTLLNESIISTIAHKEQIFRNNLTHPRIHEVRGTGLMLAIGLADGRLTTKVISNALKNGLLIDNFLCCDTAIRIAPPLLINDEQIKTACNIINKSIDEAV